jgi:hypothetical protein
VVVPIASRPRFVPALSQKFASHGGSIFDTDVPPKMGGQDNAWFGDGTVAKLARRPLLGVNIAATDGIFRKPFYELIADTGIADALHRYSMHQTVRQ